MLTEDVSPPHVENFVAPQNGNLQRCDPEISSCHKLRPQLPVGLPKLDYTWAKLSLPALKNALIADRTSPSLRRVRTLSRRALANSGMNS